MLKTAQVDTNHPLLNLAKYVLQVNLVHRTNQLNHLLGTFSVWKKRAATFGSGDELMWFCPAKGCLELFDNTFRLSDNELEDIEFKHDIAEWPEPARKKYLNWYGSEVTCSKCATVCKREDLADSYLFNMTKPRVATRMTQLWEELEGDADIFLVRTKHAGAFKSAQSILYDPNRSLDDYAAKLEQARDREMAFYPMVQINKDSKVKTVSSCFAGFLGA